MNGKAAAPTLLVARIAFNNTDTEQTVTLSTPHTSEAKLSSSPAAAQGHDVEANTSVLEVNNPFQGGDEIDRGFGNSRV